MDWSLKQALLGGARVVCAVMLLAGLSACSSVNRASGRMVNAITPYQIEVVQGNFVSREQVQALQPGMSREQVRNILGTPLVTSVFHADRWDYVFTIKRKGLKFEEKKLTVFFSGFVLDRVEGDEMPSEHEFVALLGQANRKPRVPRLEATPEQLQRFAPAADRQPPAAEQAAEASPPRLSYPPLE
ncbi:outer membrane protein assembly factor BamE [Allofranklinella schreckenbergeri]|uniref:Outer membrane protein assembly factor BamE n=2 Tax=Allofranklinella schreckenbergeri TaxID=1076744 RepID=A0A3M6R5I7_9BURK|nr:outer membrane protein assembly factor BamE [Allofranklinella schreckenbergeri]RMX10576.1 outer membrane protein assembly factor BamE [Allofranklinella schreckenbergeri]RRD41563.1 outer membrane protein assembly factor BamE [Comamonadaceae bacterium OH3737_COT-264]